MTNKKYLIINRDICIGCGACVAASDGKCEFIDGRAWCKKEEITSEIAKDIIDTCPVDCISLEDEIEYDKTFEKFDIE